MPTGTMAACVRLISSWMPGLSGPEVQSRLTEFGSTLPIVFLTGYMDITLTVKALKAGADNFFIKPVRSDELLKALEKAIARHETALALKGELETLRARLSTLTPRQRQVSALREQIQQLEQQRDGILQAAKEGAIVVAGGDTGAVETVVAGDGYRIGGAAARGSGL